MNPRLTWGLAALAAALLGFILLVERQGPMTANVPEPVPRLLAIRAAEVTRIQLRLTNRLVLEVEKTNGDWHVTAPLHYPAHAERIENLLASVENLNSPKRLNVAGQASGRDRKADFGLDPPVATLTLQHGGRRSEILFGAKSPLGDEVYIQLLASPTVYVVDATLFERLPKGVDDWRDDTLLSLRTPLAERIDRLEVRAPGRGFAVVYDPTNRLYSISKPTPARADAPKVEAFLRKIAAARIVRFERDAPVPELEPYGLQPPAAELLLGQGTNDLVVVQFGTSPTNDAGLVYARRLSHTNIVLVSRSLMETLQTPYTELRDRHLLSFAAPAVDVIQVTGSGGFSVQRETNGTWQIPGSPPRLADKGLVADWLDALSRLQGHVEKEVVTDFASYGLAPPAQQYLLYTTTTNAADAVSNRLCAQLDLSAPKDGLVYARRPDENSLYTLARAVYEGLPSEPWQLRDRRVFRFTTNEVLSVTIRHNGIERKLLRGAQGNWALAPGSQGIINTFAIEEMMHRMGELRAVFWVARGEDARARYGFTDTNHKLTIELKGAEKPGTLILEFGGPSPAKIPYALADVDGEPCVFEIAVALFYDIARYLSNSGRAKGSSGS